jgi:hypothetical protein
MKFTPKTEEELNALTLVPEGIYDFEIIAAHDAISKSGNEMIQLSIHFYDKDGKLKSIDDYLLEALAYKLRHAAEACGLIEKYKKGELDAEDFIGKTGKFKLGISKGKANPLGGFYRDKNDVKDYIVGSKSSPVALDDEIPF